VLAQIDTVGGEIGLPNTNSGTFFGVTFPLIT
jgi:hypothetical protein